MRRASLDVEIASVRAVCRDVGLGAVEPVLIKAAHHSILLLTPHAMVARVRSSGPIEAAIGTAARELRVARHLADRDAPVLAPLDTGRAGPHADASAVVTLWPHAADARTAGDGDAQAAATALAAIHAALTDYPGTLPPYTQALDRCREVLASDAVVATLAASDRMFLGWNFDRLRDETAVPAARWAPLHGDVHLGNLLIGADGPRWIDFEEACAGPREYDIAGLPRSAWTLFADADRALVRRFADLRSVCVAIWCAADIARSPEIREAAAYHLGRVRRWKTKSSPRP